MDIIRELQIKTDNKTISFYYENNKISIYDNNGKSHKNIKINSDDWIIIESWINKIRHTDITQEEKDKIENLKK